MFPEKTNENSLKLLLIGYVYHIFNAVSSLLKARVGFKHKSHTLSDEKQRTIQMMSIIIVILYLCVENQLTLML